DVLLVGGGLAGAVQAEFGGDGRGGAVVRVDGGDDVVDAVGAEPVQQGAGGLGGETEALVGRPDDPGDGGAAAGGSGRHGRAAGGGRHRETRRRRGDGRLHVADGLPVADPADDPVQPALLVERRGPGDQARVVVAQLVL